jgi:hypothetical protein
MLSTRSRPSLPNHPVPRDVELVPDGPVVHFLASLQVRRDDKEVFDQLKAWWSLKRGREVTQWEAFTLVLAAALEHEEARVPV